MFISSAEKQEIFDRLVTLELSIRELQQAIDNLKAPYGRCKDGTPRAKPGMKTGQKKAVTK